MNSVRKMTNSKASLFIVADLNDQNFDNSTYLLNLFNSKLNGLNIQLNQIFIITDKAQLIDQLKLIAKNACNDWIFITTTSELTDNFMYSILEENNNDMKHQNLDSFQYQVPLYNERIFILNKSFFDLSLATSLRYIFKKQTKKLAFKDQSILNDFINKLNENFGQQIEVKPLFSNYANMIELDFKNEAICDEFKKSFGGYGDTDVLDDNYINADFYVYNFDHCSGFLKKDSNDIVYLREKIDHKMFIEKLNQSIVTLEKCFKVYKSEEISVSFNGGKDCCVVMYLAYAVALRLGIKFPLNALLIQIKNQFKEMNEFVELLTNSKYRKKVIDFTVFNDSKTMKDSLNELKELRPEIKAILMGTRRSDGAYFTNLEPFAYTDGDWPKYMRINPILDWTFSEVWYFIRMLELPYCSLYDKGYTSIDNTLNTVPNKELASVDGTDYSPAWMLKNQASERYSRKKL